LRQTRGQGRKHIRAGLPVRLASQFQGRGDAILILLAIDVCATTATNRTRQRATIRDIRDRVQLQLEQSDSFSFDSRLP
jgi:hypothetical protein